MQRPNIVYLNSHDTGRYVSPYGHAFDTPSLDRLAKQGVLFSDAHCNAPTCSPSRACLLTGRPAHSAGMLGLAHRGFSLDNYDQHLARYLKKKGYDTVQCGTQHVTTDPARDIGYDTILKGDTGVERTANAVGWLRDRPADGEPFYLELGYGETHRTSGKDHPVAQRRRLAGG